VRVSGVVPDSPAAKAAIREGDILTRVNGTAVANLQEYSNLLRTLTPGQRVTVVVRRGADELTIEVTLAER
jgi:S1-C subfamily serine protease